MEKREPKLVGELIRDLIRKGEILPSITKNVEAHETEF